MIKAYRCNYLVCIPSVCFRFWTVTLDPLGCLASGRPRHFSTLWWSLLWFLPVAELLLCFTATQKQITSSELGVCLRLGIHIIFVWVATHLLLMGCHNIAGGLYRSFLHSSFFQSKLVVFVSSLINPLRPACGCIYASRKYIFHCAQTNHNFATLHPITLNSVILFTIVYCVFCCLEPSMTTNAKLNKLIFLYLKTRHCKCYALNIMYIKLHKLSWIPESYLYTH